MSGGAPAPRAPEVTEVKRSLLGPTFRFRGPRLDYDGPPGRRRLAYGYRLEGDRVIGGVELRAGNPAVGLFWEDRPYNVYLWLSPEGAPLGLYFNVGDRTRIEPDRVEWRDLVLDVVVPLAPKGEPAAAGDPARAGGPGAARDRPRAPDWSRFEPAEPVVLDREELPDDLPPALARQIRRGLAEVLRTHAEVWREIRAWIGPLVRLALRAHPHGGAP